MLHLKNYTHECILNVSTEMQEFFYLYAGCFVSARAIIGVHKSVLHAFTVFEVNEGVRRYIATMQQRDWTERVPVEEMIRRRIKEIEAEQSPEGYPADWALRGLVMILRDAPLTPYGAGHSLLRQFFDYCRGVPNLHQMREHEEALLEPIGLNLTEITVECMRAQRGKAA